MSRVILVRHGESELNRDGIFYGWLDPGLTEKGREQAAEAREILKELHYDEIYSSDLIRARETAEIMNYKNLPLSEATELRELNFGIFEGLRYEDILRDHPEEEVLWREDWKNYDYETGESVKDLQKRSVEFIESRRSEGKNILIVAHWGVINCVLSHYITGGLEGYWKFATKNCGITVLNFKDEFPVLEGMNIGGRRCEAL